MEAKMRWYPFEPLGDAVIVFNGGVRCDMAVGPCACGAWHEKAEPDPDEDSRTTRDYFKGIL